MEVAYEELFLLQYYGLFGFNEAHALPIGLRKWYLKKLKSQFEMEAEAVKSR